MILRTLALLCLLCILPLQTTNSAKDDWPLLLLTNRDNVLLIPSAQPENTQVVASGMERACDFIYQDQLIFWIDEEKGRIQSINMSAPNRKKINVIDAGMAQPEDIACDWIAKKLYWTDHNSDRIEVSELNGTSRKVLIWSDLEQPRAIAVDPFHAYMYWTDWGSDPKIERAGMDGSHREVLVNKKIYFPNGITLDYSEEKVYWTEAKYCFIHRMNMDGSNREEVITSSSININLNSPRIIKNNTPATGGKEYGTNQNDGALDPPGALQHLFSITLYKDRVFWTDWETNSIYTILKNGSGVPEIIKGEYIDVSHTMDVQAYSPLRQMPGTNACGDNNGGCSHLCLLSPDRPGFKCACPTGVKIKKDKKTCENGPSEILLIARRTDLRMISLDTEDHADVLVPVNNIQHAVAVDYDPVEGYVYWTDDDEKAILRARLNGTGATERIATNSVEQSDGLAVDWIARNLYWTDPSRDYIGVSRLNGTSRKILIESGIDEPRAIVVDPVKGYMYWTDWGDKASIEKAYMDGTERQSLVSQHIVWPNGLAIDRDRGLLFWADAFVDRIEMIDVDGTERTVILAEKIPHVFGLSLLGDYIYWTDWQRRRVEQMKIGDKSSRKILKEFADIMGVKATSTSPVPGTNPCAILNGGCSHLCLYTPQGRRCNCPTGLELAPNLLRCIVPEAFLLYSVPTGGIRGISLDTAQSDAKIPFESMVEANVMDFSVADSMIYWTNQDMTISRAYMNGSHVESFIDIGIELLEGLAVDWIGRNVYWADGLTNRIEVARMDSTSRRSILSENMEHPRCIAMDPSRGYIYWSEWARVPCIKRAEMDGSNPIQLTKSGAVGRVNSLTIDYAARRLYWVDFDINTIMSSNMNGTDLREIIVGKDNTTAIISLTLYGDYIYWSDNKGKTIQRANKTNGENRRVIEHGIMDISMLVYHASRQSGVTACSHNNGGCQHLCLSMKGGKYKCSCPAHYTLNSDNITCSAPDNFILVSQTRYLSRIVYKSTSGQFGVLPVKTTNYRGGNGKKKSPIVVPDAVLPVRGLQDACAIDYDPIEGRVYWLDCITGDIKSSLQNGTKVILLLKGDKTVRIPFDIAVDPFLRLLYWTDLLTNSINVLKLNGEVVGTILSGSMNPGGTTSGTKVVIMPRKIVVDSERGRIYFTNACPDVNSCRFKIMQATLDGSECEILFNRGLHNVSALAVDSKTNTLYWVDKTTIETSKLSGNGNDRTTLVTSKLSEPIGLAVFGRNLYWIDAQADNGLIEAANKIDGSNRRKIQGRIKNLRDIVSVVKIDDKTIKKHPCYPDNGGCSHICVPKDDGTTRCSCPKSLTIVNESLCDEPVVCLSTEFTCKNKKCIPKTWRCDGSEECPDGSDEEDCFRCKEGEYQCQHLYTSRGSSSSMAEDGREFLQHIVDIARNCYPEKERCNGKRFCLGGEDEQGCHDCAPNEIWCGHKCVTTSVGCSKACADGTDLNCSGHQTGDSSQDPTLVIIIIIVGVCVILLVGVLVWKKCRMRGNRNHSSSVVAYIRGHSTGPVNVNVRIQPPTDEPNLGGSGPVGSRKNNGLPKPHSTTSFKVSIEQPRKGGSSRKNVPIVDAQMLPHGSHGSQHSWYTPFITRGSDGKQVIMDRPCITGESSGSSTKTLKQYLPTLNPPPSPATDRSGGKSGVDCYYSSDSHSGYHTPCRCSHSGGHKHRRSHHRQPLKGLPTPTPCTTDTCEDFDSHSRPHRHYKHGGSKSGSSSNGSVPSDLPPPYCGGSCCYHCHHYSRRSRGCYSRHSRGSSIHQRRVDGSSSGSSSSHHQCGGGNPPSSECSCEEYPPSYPPSYSNGSRRHRSSKKKHSNYMSSDLNSDSDPFAPPPTPRSQYMSECCYTHDETTEAEENLDERDEENSEVEEITSRILEEKEEDEEDGTTDDADTVLLAPQPSTARTSPSMTERSYCIFNPPPSPADSS